MLDLTKEQLTISTRNKRALRKKLGIKGNGNLVLHHINPEWRHTDVERYIQWNEEDVIVMTRAEHNKLHFSGENNPSYGVACHTERKEKISKANKGRFKGIKRGPMSEEHKLHLSESLKGKSHYGIACSDEKKKKISESVSAANTGKHWFNNGLIQVFLYECPEGFVQGMLRRNNL